jgi:aminoglycoside phosphotransferase (APT) family kinase protein
LELPLQHREKMTSRGHVESEVERALDARKGKLAANREPHAPTSLDDVARRLDVLLGANLPGRFAVRGLAPLTGGASKQHFVFDLEEPDGGGARSMVLRTALGECLGTPPNFRREGEVQRALAGRVPVPEVVCVDPDGEHFKAPAILLGRVPGVTVPPEAAGRPSGLGLLFPPERRAKLAGAFLENLCRIHSFADCDEAASLRSFERPRPGTTEASEWLIAWWRRVWDDDALEDHPMVRVAFDWLEENAPPTERISLVHGDYRSGNFLFDPEQNRVTAVLDWELARFGDRHEDLGWTLSSINGATDDGGASFVCGLEPRESFLARYAARSGLAVDPERLFFYEVFAELKIAVIALGIGPRNAAARQSHAHLGNLVFAPLGWRSLARLRDLLGPVVKR